ncbi:chromate transporter [Paenibacillus harenae]|uniref:Chromate transporter n=1 Tax=Paenibacillus harenae TaxID=306543 RepID=A0ABT9U718_PAEHA|nr:chromate transporter [Paenibacillus harenae]MDQ0115442.1 chromate transporter [Paenibacillus harenae]
MTSEAKGKKWLEVLLVSTKLGLTSFGGPIAHLGYFHEEYVKRRKWLDEKSYADLVALSQFLPGPASSQVGIGIGVMRAGLLGGILAFIGFTLPSALALALFALLVHHFDLGNAGWVHGLKIVAVAIVAQAVLGMGQKLTPDRSRIAIAVIAASISLLWQSAFSQVSIIVAAGIIGLLMFKANHTTELPKVSVPVSRRLGTICLMLFLALLIGLPVLRNMVPLHEIAVFDSFYRSGSLVFGGGHVVLPLLERELVAADWIGRDEFLAGYGATQAIPGPLFAFSSYLGAMMNGWLGALIATIAIFLPAFLLIVGTLPYWDSLRRKPKVQGALIGINASVVGLLLGALYHPIWTSSIVQPIDFALAAMLFVLLVYWKMPPWIVVLAGALAGILIKMVTL